MNGMMRAGVAMMAVWPLYALLTIATGCDGAIAKPVVTILDVKSVEQQVHERRGEDSGRVYLSEVKYIITQQDGTMIVYFAKTGSRANHALNNITPGHMYRLEFHGTAGEANESRFTNVVSVEKLD